jgi:hypothetical protein
MVNNISMSGVRTAFASDYNNTQGLPAHLLQDPDFALAFTDAKTRLRAMNIRVVEESNALRQALLEMYVDVALAAPYNDFDNH